MSLRECEIDQRFAGQQRKVEPGRELDVLQREHPDRSRRQRHAISDMNARSRREIDAWTVAERSRRNDVAEILDEAEIPFELEWLVLVEMNTDVELLAAAGTETEGREVKRDGVEDIELEIRQRAFEGEAAWACRGWRHDNRLADAAVDR